MRLVLTMILLVSFGRSAMAETASSLTGTLKKIHDTGVITLGHRESYQPFSYVEGTGKKPIGYSLDICHKIVGAVGTELKMPNLGVDYVMVNPQNRVEMVKSGKIDLECSATTHTFGRRKDVDFSEVIMTSTIHLYVKKSSGIHELSQLAKKKIAVASNTTNLSAGKAMAKETHVDATWVETKDHDAAFDAVVKGQADAAVLEDLIAIGLIAKSKEPEEWTAIEPLISAESNAFMLRQNDSAFRLVVDRAISRLCSSGEITNIYDKWFTPLKQPMSPVFKSVIKLQSMAD